MSTFQQLLEHMTFQACFDCWWFTPDIHQDIAQLLLKKENIRALAVHCSWKRALKPLMDNPPANIVFLAVANATKEDSCCPEKLGHLELCREQCPPKWLRWNCYCDPHSTEWQKWSNALERLTL